MSARIVRKLDPGHIEEVANGIQAIGSRRRRWSVRQLLTGTSVKAASNDPPARFVVTYEPCNVPISGHVT